MKQLELDLLLFPLKFFQLVAKEFIVIHIIIIKQKTAWPGEDHTSVFTIVLVHTRIA